MLSNFRRARNLQRYHRIVSVLARHGFGSFLQLMGADRYLPVLNPSIFQQRAPASKLTPAEHLRLALEELGPTFIKLGQILSTRADLFPPEYIVELTKLQEGVAPNSWESLVPVLKEECQCNPEDIFQSIDETPLGSASLAQVHAAVLKDGRSVVIKIQRPNIIRTIHSDLNILTDLAGIAQRTEWGKLYNPVEIVAHFAHILNNELDYRLEGANAEKFRASFANEPHLYIPEVIWEYSTQRVLVMERLTGVKIDDHPALDAAGLDRREVARYASQIIVKEILEDGFFHADPHPGNFLVLARENSSEVVIGAMDFGMVGHVSRTDRTNLLQAYAFVAKKDAKGMVDHLLRIGAIGAETDTAGLERDVDRLIAQYHGLALKHLQIRRVMEEMMQIAFHYRISLPADMWLLFKTLMMIDGLARQLDPEVDIFAILTPAMRRLLSQTHMPWFWGPTFMTDIEALAYALRDIPSIGENILRTLQSGRLPFSVSFGASKETLDRMDRMTTRFSLSILATAFILGLALLVPISAGNPVAEVLVGIGFLAAIGLGLWLAYSIIRSGR